MTVKIDGTGFTPGAPHAQHLHGVPEGVLLPVPVGRQER
jgi:hypothetical protein